MPPRRVNYCGYIPPEIIIEELEGIIRDQKKEIKELRAELLKRTRESIAHSKAMMGNVLCAALDAAGKKQG